MNRLKPYTIGILSSIIFHLPLIYFFCNRQDAPKKEIALVIDPALIECTIKPVQGVHHLTLKLPPITQPPKYQ